jgi:hypothetical protein
MIIHLSAVTGRNFGMKQQNKLGCGLVEFLLGTAKILKKTPIFDLGN